MPQDESITWNDITEPVVRQKTGKKSSPAIPARRAFEKRLANLGPMIAIGGTCVLLVAALLVWNSTRRSPVVAKAEQKYTNEQRKARQSPEPPKVIVHGNVILQTEGLANSPVEAPQKPSPIVPPPAAEAAKPAAPMAAIPPKETPVVEVPPVATPIFEAPTDKPVVEKPPEKSPNKN